MDIITYISGTIRAHKISKFSSRLYQETAKLILESNLRLSNDDNLFLVKEAFAFATFCFSLEYNKTFLDRANLYGVIFEVTLSSITGTMRKTLITAGADKEEAKLISEHFKDDTRDYAQDWVVNLPANQPERKRSDIEAFEIGLSKLKSDLISFAKIKTIYLPKSFDSKLENIVISLLIEANLLKKLNL